MNYFQLFDIPVSLKVNKAGLAKKYFELQKKFHPDFYSDASADEQAAVLETSSMINKAFKILQHEDETIKYVLQIKGLLEEEEKYTLPQDFLLEMMEFNEAILDAKMEGGGTAGVEHRISHLKKELYEPVKEIVEHYQEGVSSEKALLQVKDYYYRKKYLNRILEGLK